MVVFTRTIFNYYCPIYISYPKKKNRVILYVRPTILIFYIKIGSLYFKNIVIKAYHKITLRSHKGMAFIDVAIKYDKFKLYPVYFKGNG